MASGMARTMDKSQIAEAFTQILAVAWVVGISMGFTMALYLKDNQNFFLHRILQTSCINVVLQE